MKLLPHPETPQGGVSQIHVSVWCEEGRWHFRYVVDHVDDLSVPVSAKPKRADELWKTTCFEAFVAGQDGGYCEFNFSPSGQWAAYAFDAPRQGRRNANAEVEVWLEGGADWIAVEASVAANLGPEAAFNLTAVIEASDGGKSYWALAHPPGVPDFHDPSCFLGRLPE